METTPTRYRAARSDSIPEKGRLVIDVGDTTIGIFRVDGRLFAYENSCPHMGGPVCQGLIIPAVRELVNEQKVSTGYAFDESEMRIVCPWHGYEYDLRTGECAADRRLRLKTYEVVRRGEDIYVRAG